MRNKDLISVIIPAYNAEKLISKTIDSILNQTYINIELIVINDGSIDDTEQVVKSYGHKIQYYYQENKGVAEARNHGLSVSKGEYIAFVDADDYVFPEMYEKMLNEALKSDSDMVLCSIFFENESGLRRKEYEYAQKNYNLEITSDIRAAFRAIGNSCCNKLYKTKIIKDIKFPKFKLGEDALFVLECILRSKKISCINEPLYVYFQNSHSVTKRGFNLEDIVNHQQVHIEKRNLIERYGLMSVLNHELREYYVKCFLMYTNSINQIINNETKELCWKKWLQINKEDFVRNTVLIKIIKISKNINWVYYVGMILTGKFFKPVLTRIKNVNYFLEKK